MIVTCLYVQPTNLVHMCVFDISDGSRWKAMSDDAIRSVCDADWPSFPPLSVSPLDSALISNELEHELRALITGHRRVATVCLSVCLLVFTVTRCHETVCCYLSPATCSVW